MSHILAIGTAVPSFAYSQDAIREYMTQVLGWEGKREERKLRLLYQRTKIAQRHSVLPDFDLGEKQPHLFSKEAVPGLSERMKLYGQHALPLAAEAANACLAQAPALNQPEEITHLITVSCTGLRAPGLEMELIAELGLSPSIMRFAVNFIGCYAAFHALKMADAFARSRPDARVLIVCVELCTLHFQHDTDQDNLLANALFADGAAATLVVSEELLGDVSAPKIRIDAFASHLAWQAKEEMSWAISEQGFLMRLSSYVPQVLEAGMRPLLDSILTQLEIEKSSIHYWGIHPGGRRILELCAKELALTEEKLAASFHILSQYGNMSAPTILFVLADMWDHQIDWDRSSKLFLAGFGPGLTLESAILSI